MNACTGIAAILAAAALALTGCSGQGDSTSAAKDRPTEPAAVSNTRTLTTVDDTELQVPDGKPAVVFFFSYRCGHCFDGGKQVVAAHQKASLKADFLLAALDPNETKQEIDTFRNRIGGEALPAVSAGVVELSQDWKVTALSTVVVLERGGDVVFRGVDPPAKDILDAIDKATAE